MAYERPRISDVRGRTITIAHLEIPQQPKTYLTADVAAAGTSLTVSDNAGFANSQLILIGELGTEKTEIKKINAAVSAGTSLTSTAVTFDHSAGTSLRRFLFNQWKIYGNSTNTSSGATLIATIDMQVDAPFTTYINTSTEYNFYLVLPSDSLNAVDGDTYSDGVSNSSSYALNTVGSLIESALQSTKLTLKKGSITDAWFFREINDCLRFITGKLKRWSWLQNFNYVLGQTARGTYNYTLPTDIEDQNSIKSILDVRIGDSDTGLIYQDKKEFEDRQNNVVITQVRTQATSGSTTLEIDNSYDFPDSGSVVIYISGTKYTLTYTGVTRSATAGILTGIPASGDGSISTTIPVDTNVFYNESEGQPLYFTVYDGILYIWPLPNATYDNFNVYLDYYIGRTIVDSAADTIEGQRYDLVKHWLIWKVRALSTNATGELSLQDGDFMMFNQILSDMIKRELNGQKHKMIPKYNGIFY